MSIEQQEARIIEAPKAGWVVWLSQEALDLIKEAVEEFANNSNKVEVRQEAYDLLEGIY